MANNQKRPMDAYNPTSKKGIIVNSLWSTFHSNSVARNAIEQCPELLWAAIDLAKALGVTDEKARHVEGSSSTTKPHMATGISKESHKPMKAKAKAVNNWLLLGECKLLSALPTIHWATMRQYRVGLESITNKLSGSSIAPLAHSPSVIVLAGSEECNGKLSASIVEKFVSTIADKFGKISHWIIPCTASVEATRIIKFVCRAKKIISVSPTSLSRNDLMAALTKVKHQCRPVEASTSDAKIVAPKPKNVGSHLPTQQHKELKETQPPVAQTDPIEAKPASQATTSTEITNHIDWGILQMETQAMEDLSFLDIYTN